MKQRLLISILSLFLFFTVSNINAQKCDVKADPITGEKTCSYMNKQQTLKYLYKGGNTTDFYITFIYAGEQNVTMPIGSEVIFKLKDNTIITLVSDKEASPITKLNASQYGASVTSYYTFSFKLTHEQVKLLAGSKISFLRYPNTDGGTIDYDVKGLGKVYTKKITKGAICVLENIETWNQ